jgi:hypothetical protein
MVQWKYRGTIPLGRNNVPIVRTDPGYNLPNSTATNSWLTQTIKAYNAFIPKEYELSDTHQHISIINTIDDEMEVQPKLNRCDSEKELLLWHQRLAHMPFKVLQNMPKIGHLPRRS